MNKILIGILLTILLSSNVKADRCMKSVNEFWQSVKTVETCGLRGTKTDGICPLAYFFGGPDAILDSNLRKVRIDCGGANDDMLNNYNKLKQELAEQKRAKKQLGTTQKPNIKDDVSVHKSGESPKGFEQGEPPENYISDPQGFINLVEASTKYYLAGASFIVVAKKVTDEEFKIIRHELRKAGLEYKAVLEKYNNSLVDKNFMQSEVGKLLDMLLKHNKQEVTEILKLKKK